MNFNFDWDYVSAGAPYITVSTFGLAFNTPSINLLGNPENIVVGFDKDSMAIGIREASPSESNRAYGFKNRVKNGWVRIGCKDFVKHLTTISGISFSPAKKYVAKFDEDEGILYITVLDYLEREDQDV